MPSPSTHHPSSIFCSPPFWPTHASYLCQWYHSQVSKLKPGDESMLRRLKVFGILNPGPEHRAHLPPGHLTFCKAQLQSGLRFSIPSFYQDVARHYRVTLGQLQPNSFRHMATTYAFSLHRTSHKSHHFQLILLVQIQGWDLYHKLSSPLQIHQQHPHLSQALEITLILSPRSPVLQLPYCMATWSPTSARAPFLRKQSVFFIRSQEGLGGRNYDAHTFLHEDFLNKYGLSSRDAVSIERSAESGHRTTSRARPDWSSILFIHLLFFFSLMVVLQV